MPNGTISTLVRNLRDDQSLRVEELIRRAADLNSNLLIFGETGVGKDFWISYLQEITGCPTLLNLHCADVPENLIESEWFGYSKGAFTGAEKDYEGKWKKAEGGILFLNRIDLLSLNVQSKLLRIIERKKYYALGSGVETDIDARFVFSADDDIEHKVRENRFRADLYYRVSTVKVRVPPLRERPADILPLVEYVARQRSLRVELSARAADLLVHYPWMGNIREIENFIVAVSIEKDRLTDEDVTALIKNSDDFFETVKRTDMSLAELETRYIEFLIRKYKNKARVAEILKISRKTLYNKT
ncbi:MAG: sigma-54-dependent transcriptional regulator [Candidatus Omnitrophota bacterium]